MTADFELLTRNRDYFVPSPESRTKSNAGWSIKADLIQDLEELLIMEAIQMGSAALWLPWFWKDWHKPKAYTFTHPAWAESYSCTWAKVKISLAPWFINLAPLSKTDPCILKQQVPSVDSQRRQHSENYPRSFSEYICPKPHPHGNNASRSRKLSEHVHSSVEASRWLINHLILKNRLEGQQHNFHWSKGYRFIF